MSQDRWHRFFRFNAPKEELKWYYEGIATNLTRLTGSQMLSELKESIGKIFDLKDALHVTTGEIS